MIVDKYTKAMKVLARYGLNDSMAGWIECLPVQLGILRQHAQAVAKGIMIDADYVYYAQDGQEETDANAARAAIVDALLEWKFKEVRGFIPTAGLVGVSKSTFVAADQLNSLKKEWQTLHMAMRYVAGHRPDGSFDTKHASDAMRTALKRIDEPRLDLDATDRQIPLIPGQPLTLNWYTVESAPSERRKMADVLADILKLIDDAGDPTEAAMYQAEYVRLESQPRDTPVAYRSRKPVTSARFRTSYVLNNKRKSMTHYAASPILFLQGNEAIQPKLSVFEPKNTGGRAGARHRISNDRVSRLKRLPHYYWYLVDPKPHTAPTKPEKAKNPYSATAFPGIWLGTRRTASGALNPSLLIQLNDRSQRRVSIAKKGIAAAWAEGAAIYSADRDIPLDAILARCPTEQNVSDMLTWAETMLDT